MKKKKKGLNAVFIITILVVIIAVWQCFEIVHKPLKINGDEIVEVSEGDSFYGILNKLSEDKKLKSEFLVKLYLKVRGIQPDVLEGKYKLEKNMTLNDIITVLSSESAIDKIYITIPEGYTIEDIAEELQEHNICSSEEFLNAVKNYELPAYVSSNPNKRYNLEGFLFPDTYRFNENEDANFIIKTMLERFEEVWNESVQSLNLSIPNDQVEKVITVASIIEKEARVDSERSLIASVIYNRINIGMPLQIDATVIYSNGHHIEKMYEKYLDIDSPYNTYMYYGLPVGPISNPGKESIIAALDPENTEYLYYLLETENTHYFTNDYDDFLRRKEELGY